MTEADKLKLIKQVAYEVLSRLNVSQDQRDEIEAICTLEVLTQLQNCQISGQKPSKRYLSLKAYQGARAYLDAEKAERHEPLTGDIPETFIGIGEGYTPSELADAIQGLPKLSQRLLRLHYWDGLSHREIAETLGVSKGDVLNKLSAAAQELREALQGADE